MWEPMRSFLCLITRFRRNEHLFRSENRRICVMLFSKTARFKAMTGKPTDWDRFRFTRLSELFAVVRAPQHLVSSPFPTYVLNVPLSFNALKRLGQRTTLSTTK